MIRLARLGFARSDDLIARLRDALALAFGLAAGACRRVTRVLSLGLGQFLDLIARFCTVLAAACAVTSRATTGLITDVARVRVLATGQFRELVARLGAVLAAACVLLARTIVGAADQGITRGAARIAQVHRSLTMRGQVIKAGVIVSSRQGSTRLARWLMPPRSLPAISPTTSVRAAWVMLGLALLASALQGTTTRLHQPAPLAPSSRPRVDPTSTASLLPPAGAPDVEPASTVLAAARIEQPLPYQTKKSVPLLPRSSVREMAGEASALPTSGPQRSAPRTDIVGRLSARNRTTNEHDFAALLAEVGGSELGRLRGAASTAVEVLVPESHYNDFVRGLGRIGSWQLEAARLPLPVEVHMTIRVTE